MVTLTPDMAGTTIVVMVVVYVFTLGYSIYMAVLNYKQAKVKDILIETNKLISETNKILLRVENSLKR